MNKGILVTCIAFLMLPRLDAAQLQYEVDVKILSYPTGLVTVTSQQMQSDRVASRYVLTAPAPAEIEVSNGDHRPPLKLHLGEGGLDKAILPKDVESLSAPRVTTVAGASARIMIVQHPQYFEKQGDGSFQLHEMPDPQWVGVAAQYLIKPQNSEGDEIVVDGSLENNWIQSRETITNVFLEVGKPDIVHNRVETSVHLKSGQWCLLTTPGAFGAPNRSMMLLFKVQRVDPRGMPF
jgi:hypothetical protein